ncbi:Uncharacterised protein [Streptococcus pneumoniae]|nr:Uncharacterised protein [Streptococcus pneumoniae]CGF55308.1 Uncharacterised protein [Streptococcus pneumoniae]CIW20025.1 Uncharacterised protein [Streptococcus pneumoniae]CJD89102.1 Uncharacterised protein [Streptococcus pneumoniae]CJG59351.1 Uncharacterised protein [Streptococcus pneumoniae]
MPRPEAIPVKIPFSRNCLKTVGIVVGINPVFEFRNVSSISKKTILIFFALYLNFASISLPLSI